MTYTFDFINRDESVDHFDLGFFADDQAAVRSARAALLASTSAVRVAVWSRGRRVAEIGRPQGAQRFALRPIGSGPTASL